MNQIDASYLQVFSAHAIGRDLLRLPGNPAPPLQEPAPGDTNTPDHLPSPDFDGVWKEALRRWLPQCLELFWPHVHAQVNWRAPPVFLDKELKQLGRVVKQGTRHVDVLARLTLLNGRKALLLVHLEVQGGAIGPSFPERMLRYHVRIRERHPGQPLMSCAILLDREHGPDTERYAEEAFGCEHSFTFPVVNLAAWRSRMAELRTLAAHNPMAVVVLAQLETRATAPDDTRLASKFALARALIRWNYPAEVRRQLFLLLDSLMVLPEPLDEHFFDIFDTEEPDMVMQRLNSLERVMLRREKAAGIQEGLLEGRIEGRMEGRVEGRVEGEALMLQRQITRRFGPLSQDTLDRLKTATAAQLETWGLNLLDASTLEDVFRD